ncbi:MAG: UDP-glucose/GDP-mannose dehydrogenase family protein [Candidatus Calescibacterium sp.]|nr:UDP-glucose/GDP-mannose dehydrogenase family protein [Candidatus Calescibacterium sp.]MCX7972041.1 UDP-glucose/GDP-mannose dehydrogenase family protein [bacterium]MDW8194675.1 UDP-glucose/GDP-mannose dehydrogenase family protein [Candidatus Calescibacterium sp.]
MVLLKEKLEELEYKGEKKDIKIGIIGAGYVGLVTSVGLSYKGYDVLVFEKNKEKLSLLKKGISPFYEPDLHRFLTSALNSGRLKFIDEVSQIIKECKYIYICVGTPIKEDQTYDMFFLDLAAKEIANHLPTNERKIIIIKSTVPPGTARWFQKIIYRYRRGKKTNIEVASIPEFLREGNAIYDFFNPNRIIIGIDNKEIVDDLRQIYHDFPSPIIIVSTIEAELIKLASNTFLATKISFINSISDICEQLGCDIENVRMGIGLDHRIGLDFLKPGIGFGGSCLPKDLNAIISLFKEKQIDPVLFEAVKKINNDRINLLLNKIKKALWNVKGKNITIWGISFKAGTDDIRESPTLKLIPMLLKEGANLILYDPKATNNFKNQYPQYSVNTSIKITENIYESVVNSNLIVITNDWEDYKKVNFSKIYELMETPIIIDGRNILDHALISEHGFEYYRIGVNHESS